MCWAGFLLCFTGFWLALGRFLYGFFAVLLFVFGLCLAGVFGCVLHVFGRFGASVWPFLFLLFFLLACGCFVCCVCVACFCLFVAVVVACC